MWLAEDTAMRVQAEDGRPVTGLNIFAIICNFPQGRDTKHFSSGDAFGSTSQTAYNVEALEVGCSTLLVGEATCATNFMMRDSPMAKLVQIEPITPFLHRVRGLYQKRVVSTRCKTSLTWWTS